jgi:hypothetical protein
VPAGTSDLLLSELPMSDADREVLPFDTCAHWQQQRLSVAGLDEIVVGRSFSWRLRSAEGWSFRGNEALFCPRCYRTWAYLDFGRPMAFRETPGCLWPRGQACADCAPASGEIPGSLLDVGPYNTDLPLLYAMPLELVKREFELHLQFIERETSGAYASTSSASS